MTSEGAAETRPTAQHGAGPGGRAGSRVVLHVGAPKSGTTFLQEALWLHRDALLEQGFRCPGRRQRDMFLAAIDVRGTQENWGLSDEQVAGRWRRMSTQARRFRGTTIMSHELLAAATGKQAAAALAELEGLDVHVVFTARDLPRQVVSEWQERVKNGSETTFEEFAESVVEHLSSGQRRGLFWRSHDLPAVLARWGGELPAGNVHVVTAPPPGTDPRELWRRFGSAVGFDAAALDPVSPQLRANQALGTTQVAILRQVNRELGGRVPQPGYARVVKRLFAQDLLARHSSPRPACPPELVDALGRVASGWVAEVGTRGYAVHGSLDDLLPRDASIGARHPDDVDAREQAGISAAVIADLLVEVSDLRTRVEDLSRAQTSDPGPARRLRQRARQRARRLRDAVRRS